jgi:lysine 2,3-aminomutase
MSGNATEAVVVTGAGPRRTVTTVAGLVAAGLVAPEAEAALAPVVGRYAVAVPPEWVAAMVAGDPDDPIGRQSLPDPTELQGRDDERPDPIGDAVHTPLPGLVHRYPDRVLLTPTLLCAVYCRFCFRRERVGPGVASGLNAEALAAALAYIAGRPEIREVILTGGDPLMLAPRRLAGILTTLDGMPQLEVIRLHTRVPVAAPERVDQALLAALACTTKPLFMAVHANHPREFTVAARAALRRLNQAGIPLLGQSVLLRGVNDDAGVLEALMRSFLANRIKPYYLHHLDPAPGTARFRVPLAEGQALVRGLRGRVSGLAQPDFVVDIPGGHGKSPVGPRYLADDGRTITDWRGRDHLMASD